MYAHVFKTSEGATKAWQKRKGTSKPTAKELAAMTPRQRHALADVAGSKSVKASRRGPKDPKVSKAEVDHFGSVFAALGVL